MSRRDNSTLEDLLDIAKYVALVDRYCDRHNRLFLAA